MPFESGGSGLHFGPTGYLESFGQFFGGTGIWRMSSTSGKPSTSKHVTPLQHWCSSPLQANSDQSKTAKNSFVCFLESTGIINRLNCAFPTYESHYVLGHEAWLSMENARAREINPVTWLRKMMSHRERLKAASSENGLCRAKQGARTSGKDGNNPSSQVHVRDSGKSTC